MRIRLSQILGLSDQGLFFKLRLFFAQSVALVSCSLVTGEITSVWSAVVVALWLQGQTCCAFKNGTNKVFCPDKDTHGIDFFLEVNSK